MSVERRESVKVTFAPEGRAVHVLQGTLLIEAAARAGVVIDTPCGGAGTCGKCRVEISRGAPVPCDEERHHLSSEELARGVRLACQTRVAGEMSAHVPAAARLFDRHILTGGKGRDVALHPTVSKHHLNLPPPELNDQRADEDRILAALAEKYVHPGLDVLRDIPRILREKRFDVTTAVADGRVIAIEPGDTTSSNCGIAFDIGTTTVVGFLLELAAGRELAVAARANPQIPMGDDVISRIRHASEPGGLEELQRSIVGGLNEIIADCCRQAGVSREHLYEATVVGNTVMTHLLLAINPESIAQAPYVATVRRAVNVQGKELGLQIHPHGIVHVLPNVAGFVGSDTVGVILASGMHETGGCTLAIDIGTNGELVIGNRDRLLACSAAAGPAFEGARIRFGMRAADGAIDKALMDSDLRLNVIGNVAPRGLCGTALIDLTAELLRVGCIEPSGRLLPPGKLPPAIPDAIKRRVRDGENGIEFLIVSRQETQIGADIVLTQRDIRELQLAKGAIAAGAAILMKEFGVAAEQLDHILLAGAFGNFIRRSMAKRIGLLPQVPDEKVLYIGNAAGAGARMALMSRNCKLEANRIGERVEYLELAGRADFQDEFTNAMTFPEN